MMIDDHGKAQPRPREPRATRRGASSSNTLDAEHQKMLDDLSALSGKEFERKYHDDQVKGHDAAISLFERYSKSADDADIKAFANRLLPTLRAHRKHLDEHPMEWTNAGRHDISGANRAGSSCTGGRLEPCLEPLALYLVDPIPITAKKDLST